MSECRGRKNTSYEALSARQWSTPKSLVVSRSWQRGASHSAPAARAPTVAHLSPPSTRACAGATPPRRDSPSTTPCATRAARRARASGQAGADGRRRSGAHQAASLCRRGAPCGGVHRADRAAAAQAERPLRVLRPRGSSRRGERHLHGSFV